MTLPAVAPQPVPSDLALIRHELGLVAIGLAELFGRLAGWLLGLSYATVARRMADTAEGWAGDIVEECEAYLRAQS